jgi:hypothetical protein
MTHHKHVEFNNTPSYDTDMDEWDFDTFVNLLSAFSEDHCEKILRDKDRESTEWQLCSHLKLLPRMMLADRSDDRWFLGYTQTICKLYLAVSNTQTTSTHHNNSSKSQKQPDQYSKVIEAVEQYQVHLAKETRESVSDDFTRYDSISSEFLEVLAQWDIVNLQSDLEKHKIWYLEDVRHMTPADIDKWGFPPKFHAFYHWAMHDGTLHKAAYPHKSRLTHLLLQLRSL